MANTHKWDLVPVYGVWLNPVTDTPIAGTVSFTVAGRITRTDGHEIYPAGATTTVTVGDTAAQDPVMCEIVRAAWRATDEAAEIATTGTFDALAWDTRWTTVILPAAVFLSFPAGNDPDIVQDNIGVTVVETLAGAPVTTYSIEPLVEQLALPVPGINLGLIEVPPGSTGAVPAMYAKGIPGGVASLDAAGKVPAWQLRGSIAASVDVEDLTGLSAIGEALIVAPSASSARATIDAASGAQGAKADSAVQPATLAGYVTTGDVRLADQRTPLDGSVTGPKIAAGAVTDDKIVGMSAGKLTETATAKVFTSTERAKLAALGTTLDSLTDVTTTGADPGEALVFDGTEWVPGATASALDGLTDVNLTTTPPAVGNVLVFNGSEWVPGVVTGGGGSDRSVRSDVVGTYSYIGTAPAGSAETSAVWTITRIATEGTGAVATATPVAWSDRHTAVYT